MRYIFLLGHGGHVGLAKSLSWPSFCFFQTTTYFPGMVIEAPFSSLSLSSKVPTSYARSLEPAASICVGAIHSDKPILPRLSASTEASVRPQAGGEICRYALPRELRGNFEQPRCSRIRGCRKESLGDCCRQDIHSRALFLVPWASGRQRPLVPELYARRIGLMTVTQVSYRRFPSLRAFSGPVPKLLARQIRSYATDLLPEFS